MIHNDSVTGVLYFVSCTVNPILYNVMSRRFRQAFLETICRRDVNAAHWHATDACHQQMSAQRTALAVVRRGHLATEMVPSNHHHQQQQQQQQSVIDSKCTGL